MGPVTRAVQTGVGLFAELKAAHEERNGSQVSPDEISTDVKDLNMNKRDEDEDESEDDQHFGGGGGGGGVAEGHEDDDEPPAYTEEDLANLSDAKYPQPSDSAENSKLSCPIIIPQRRPGSKGRGFLRAYAPVLADHDIDEQTFLTFLKDFHKASQNANTYAAKLSTNTFLDQANASLFKPRGLYCLVMSLRPNDIPKGNIGVESVDSSSAALKWLDPNKSTFRAKLRDSSGVTHGEAEMPETAPLVYPDTGYAELSKTAKVPGEQKSGEFSSYQKVVGKYFDKRAQAKYAYKHPESSLAAQEKPQFASKYGDPTHPSVTMNYWGRAVSKIEKESLADRQARRHAKALEAKRRGGGIRRLLEGSVLYLMVVNLPSDAEVEEAKKAMEEVPATHSSEAGEKKSSSA